MLKKLKSQRLYFRLYANSAGEKQLLKNRQDYERKKKGAKLGLAMKT